MAISLKIYIVKSSIFSEFSKSLYSEAPIRSSSKTQCALLV